MPTFHGPLGHLSLQEFLFKFSLWGAAHFFTSQQLKFFLPLAIHSSTAMHYFYLARHRIADESISWDSFSTSFLQDCPHELVHQTSLLEIFRNHQPASELSSIFVQRLLYLLDSQRSFLPDKDVIATLLPLLQPGARYFIVMRGLPSTPKDLLDLCRSYDQSILRPNISSHSPHLLAGTSNEPPLPSRSSSPINVPPRSSRHYRMCLNCRRVGHRSNRCWNLRNNICR